MRARDSSPMPALPLLGGRIAEARAAAHAAIAFAFLQNKPVLAANDFQVI